MWFRLHFFVSALLFTLMYGVSHLAFICDLVDCLCTIDLFVIMLLYIIQISYLDVWIPWSDHTP